MTPFASYDAYGILWQREFSPHPLVPGASQSESAGCGGPRASPRGGRPVTGPTPATTRSKQQKLPPTTTPFFLVSSFGTESLFQAQARWDHDDTTFVVLSSTVTSLEVTVVASRVTSRPRLRAPNRRARPALPQADTPVSGVRRTKVIKGKVTLLVKKVTGRSREGRSPQRGIEASFYTAKRSRMGFLFPRREAPPEGVARSFSE